jgi:hypothetical protein
MPLDFRYYISSIAAIFFALGIGIVIGGALMNNGEIPRSKEQLIQNLEQEFAQLRLEIKTLQASIREREVELEVLRQFNREIVPMVVTGLLENRKIGIVKTNHTIPSELTADLMAILKLTGAELLWGIELNAGPEPAVEPKILAARLGLEGDPLSLNQLLTAFTNALITGEDGGLLAALQANNLIQIHSATPSEVRGLPDTLILLGGSNEDKINFVDQIDLVVAKQAKLCGLVVAGVEPLTVKISYIPKYKRSGLIVIDNINTLPGQVALVLALAAGEQGHYGVKETARSLLPKLSLQGLTR